MPKSEHENCKKLKSLYCINIPALLIFTFSYCPFSRFSRQARKDGLTFSLMLQMFIVLTSE